LPFIFSNDFVLLFVFLCVFLQAIGRKQRKQESVEKIRTQKMTANRLGYLPAAGGTHQHSDDDATSKS
jgi:hypothetical protein